MSELPDLVCPRCTAPVPRKVLGEPGTQRVWCSDRCRRAACAERKRRPCPRCGGKMNIRSAWNSTAICVACYRAELTAATKERMDDVAKLWNEGASLEEIKAYLDYGESSSPPILSRMLRLGLIEARREGYRDRHARGEFHHKAAA